MSRINRIQSLNRQRKAKKTAPEAIKIVPEETAPEAIKIASEETAPEVVTLTADEQAILRDFNRALLGSSEKIKQQIIANILNEYSE